MNNNTINVELLNLINQFKSNRTLKNLSLMKSKGLDFKIWKSGSWESLKEWRTGFKEFKNIIPLYKKINGVMTIYAAGFIK